MPSQEKSRANPLTGDPGQGILHLLLIGAVQEFADETPPEFLDQPFPLLQAGPPGPD